LNAAIAAGERPGGGEAAGSGGAGFGFGGGKKAGGPTEEEMAALQKLLGR
jgi:signal recognition particle subunit SRP54